MSILRQLAFLFLSICLFVSCSPGAKQEAKVEPVSVVLGKVSQGEGNQMIFVSGSVVSPEGPSTPAFLVPGKVLFVGPREGDYVQKGQKLAEIDPLDYQLGAAAAAAQHDQAKVGLRRAKEEYDRMKYLYDAKSLAPNDFEKFQANLDSAAEQLRQAAANDRLAQKRLSDAMLVAPIDGYIDMRGIEPGETAIPGKPVFRIVRLNPIEVNVGVPETDIDLVRVGQKAVVVIPALLGQSFEGTVRLINVGADPNTRTYMARISLPNPERVLKVGMVAEARIATGRKVSMMTVHGGAIVHDPQGATIVFVYYPKEGRVYSKRVEVGAFFGTEVEIKKGLTGDESIVLGGQDYLRDGVPVTIASPPANDASRKDRNTAQ